MTLKNGFLLTAFVLTLFLGGITSVEAQTCTSNRNCSGGKICIKPVGTQQGTCQTPPTNTSPGGSNTPDTTLNNGQTLVNPLKADNLEELLEDVLAAVIRIGTIVLILMLVWVGFLFVKARGKEEEVRTARAALMWTVIGGLILLGAQGISEVIQSTAENL